MPLTGFSGGGMEFFPPRIVQGIPGFVSLVGP
jgi:hypothetical protein